MYLYMYIAHETISLGLTNRCMHLQRRTVSLHFVVFKLSTIWNCYRQNASSYITMKIHAKQSQEIVFAHAGFVLCRGYTHRFSRPRCCPSFLDQEIRHVGRHARHENAKTWKCSTNL